MFQMQKGLRSLPTTGWSNRSPHVTTLTWGQIEVAGLGKFRDAKVFPGGARDGTGTRPELLMNQALAEKNVKTYVLPTAKAVDLYNRLCEQERAAGLFHMTC